MPKHIELKEVDNSCGSNNPDNYKYYANGREINFEEFYDIKSRAIRLENMHNTRVNGGWVFYTTAVMEGF